MGCPLLPVPETTKTDLEREVAALSQEFEAEFYLRALETRPDDVEILFVLGNVLTSLGRLEEGLRIDRRLVALTPKQPTSLYNLACSLALLEHYEESLQVLERALDAGFDDLELLTEDDDLQGLHGHPAFESLVERVKALAS